MVMSMIAGGSSFTEIASALGKSPTKNNISHSWNRELKESSGIIKPFVQGEKKSSITWTTEDESNRDHDGGWFFLH